MMRSVYDSRLLATTADDADPRMGLKNCRVSKF